ncbi:MAG: hypothetical protein AAFV90_00505 [Cyanobacteria bacterium J06634_5]
MNHRFLLRLVTNTAVFILILSCIGIVLWVIDTILGWDILPEALSLIVQAMLIAGGIIAAVLVVMNVLLSLSLIAEANAHSADLPNYGVSARLKRRVRRSIVACIVAIALLIGGLQVTNHVRARIATQAAEAQFIETQADMDESMQAVLGLFTPPLLDALETNTLAEKGQLGNTVKLFNAISTSFPHSPAVALLLPANQPPYQYARINRNSIKSDGAGNTILTPDLYTSFPIRQETEAIEQLFASTLPTVTEPLKGQVINNTVPSSWGILQRNNKVIAVVYLSEGQGRNQDFPPYSAPYAKKPAFHHNGPESLITN